MTWIPSGLSAFAAVATVAVLGGCVDYRADRREAEAERAYPPTGQFVDVNGAKIHVHVAGQGPDLVIIHGAGGNTRDYTFQFLDLIRDRYRVFIVDRPGLGWSDRAGPEYEGTWNTAAESPRLQARVLHAAVSALGAEKPIVMGHSYGGAVALAWALEFPQDTGALVVVSGASHPWQGPLGPLYRINSSGFGSATVIPLITAFSTEGATETVLKGIFAPQDPPEGYAEGFGAAMSTRRSSLRANARQVNSLKPHLAEMAPHYDQIAVPTEIVHGAVDTIVPIDIHSEALERAVPEARLTRLDGIGHMPHHAAPADVVAAIDRAAARAGLR
ncbi:MAG: alpha/beta hydrolase [Pseudomonadota bacterium]